MPSVAGSKQLDPIVFGLVVARRRHGLSLSQVATWAGVAQSTMSYIESGVSPRLHTLRSVLAVFDFGPSVSGAPPAGDFPDPVIAALHRRRLDRGLSQKQVAIAAGIDPSTVNLMEIGRRSPLLRTLRAITAVLECRLVAGCGLVVSRGLDDGPHQPVRDRSTLCLGGANAERGGGPARTYCTINRHRRRAGLRQARGYRWEAL